jgi:4-amino-4-deoxy-L-arabinose transferase-like glycosyltransferase
MIEKIDLKKVEKQTYQFTFTDGLYDMAYGSLIFFIAIAPILREILYPSYIIFLVLPAPLILILGKIYITVPRIGIAKFNLSRTKSRNKIGLLIAILFPITVILVVLTFLGVYNIKVGGYIVPVGAGLFALILLSTIAYIMDYPHFYLYAVSIGLGIPLASLLKPIFGDPMHYIISFGISGTLILLYGIITLIKFIKKYPTLKEDISNVKG